jgi:formate dehydrogenase iron-sulfur subunit
MINFGLMGVIAFGLLSFLVRFGLGLGPSTNLSDTYPWGLWIVFDLIWIALAAGAFATAGLIYITKREDLYSVGRSAVLLGFLSYTFVAVILVADLGAPWNGWQLALQAPRHSAMFEVAWCVGLYLSILAFELLPVPLEYLGIRKGLELWRKYNPVYVVFAVTIFIYLMSRNVIWAAAAGSLFAALAYAFRPKKGEKATPIMLAMAAVTLSTMHQSSLGSLFLLMPDKLSPVWWTPIMPVEFLLSAVAGGIAAVVLAEMWIARTYQRGLRTTQLATLGRVCFWALVVYDTVRFGDLAVRGELMDAFTGPKRDLFFTETLLGILPLLLLGFKKLREQPALLRVAAFMVAALVIVNRANEVLLAMTLKGTMPQTLTVSYMPSIWEWGISLAPVAATILLFSFAVKKFPILPAEEGHTIAR